MVLFIVKFVILCSISELVAAEDDKWNLNLPNQHIQYVFRHHQNLAKSCFDDEDCPYKDFIDETFVNCWGYEEDCSRENSYSEVEARDCNSKRLRDEFWIRADFGYIANIQKEMKEIEICMPSDPNDSSLVCSGHMRYCKAGNIYLDFRTHNPRNDRFKEDMFQKGMIGGHCKLNSETLGDQNQHSFALQSWYSELQNFTGLDFRPVSEKSNCDIMITKPTILMKLDSGVNLYHHFCDFFNLYLSQHVNNSWFDTDVQIVMWDTSSLGYFDIFADAWKVFTPHPIVKVQDWVGKRVCLQDAMFSLLPRMRGGLYYNSYIPTGCVGSSMFRAFSEHFLHRMGVVQDPPTAGRNNSTKIRVTLLERGKPEDKQVYRKIKNQDELIEVMKEFSDFEIKVVQYRWNKMPLVEQLRTTYNSDIFIGMHGAGLLHFLFLPDWAVAFELYNCGDERCYRDLARLRGLEYVTWQKGKTQAYDQGKHKRYGDNPKFWNWSFDQDEFRVLIAKARQLLLKNPKFLKRWKPRQFVNEGSETHNEL